MFKLCLSTFIKWICHIMLAKTAAYVFVQNLSDNWWNLRTQHRPQYWPLFQGVEQIVTKSMTGYSISSTVVLLPRSTVIVGVCPDCSKDIPPLNITYGSLSDNIQKSRTVLQRPTHQYVMLLYGFWVSRQVVVLDTVTKRNLKLYKL